MPHFHGIASVQSFNNTIDVHYRMRFNKSGSLTVSHRPLNMSKDSVLVVT